MTDLVERLRHKSEMIGDGSHGQKLLMDAADEIAELRALLAEARDLCDAAEQRCKTPDDCYRCDLLARIDAKVTK